MMMRSRRAAFVIVLWALVSTMAHNTVFAQPRPPFVVVVNPANPVTTLDRKFLEEAFLKKTTRWRDDEVIRPVDLGPGSAVRQKFSETTIRRSVASVRSYWQQMIFAGRDVPPPELDTDEEVVKYVLAHRGGVGYVSASANTGTLRIVVVR
jgi:ABC-type phosphate transport system substrate-binding protein